MTSEKAGAGVRFPPLAQNAYRILGLRGGASQREIYDGAASLRRALKLGVAVSFANELAWLGPSCETEAEARDALGRLANPAQRILERIFWLYGDDAPPAPASLAEIQAAAEIVRKGEKPHSRHDAALLSLASLLRFDAGLREREAWARALRLWKEVVAGEEFWSLLVAADLKGDFEQLTTHAEVRQARRQTMRLVTTPIVEIAKDAVARNESNTCRNALSILRDASLPEKLYAEHESDILGPVEANFDEVCRQVFAWVRIVTRGRRDPSAKANIAHEALRKYDEKLKPQLKQILEVAGRESLITRRAFESVAAQLNEVATAFRAIGDLKQGLSAIGSAYALAPPGSATLLLVEESLRSMGRGESIRARTEGEYFAALARELLPSPPPRELFTEYIKAESRSNRESESFGYYWLISVMCMCGVLTVFNLGNRKPNYRDSFPYRGININYNYRVPVPQMTPLPPINIDTLMAPPKPTSAERRKETKAARTARRRDAKGTKKP